jgi:hypothetical protein
MDETSPAVPAAGDPAPRARLPLTGGCQCGARRYEATAAPLTLYACHCEECRRQSASAFGLSLLVRPEDLRLDRAGLGTWRRPRGAGGDMVCRFCPDCGARLMHEGRGVVSVKAGTLDHPWALRPAGHIWADRAAPWMRAAMIEAGGVIAPRNPGEADMAALQARFAALNPFG